MANELKMKQQLESGWSEELELAALFPLRKRCHGTKNRYESFVYTYMYIIVLFRFVSKLGQTLGTFQRPRKEMHTMQWELKIFQLHPSVSSI